MNFLFVIILIFSLVSVHTSGSLPNSPDICYEPVVIDYSHEGCKAAIENLINTQIAHCKLVTPVGLEIINGPTNSIWAVDIHARPVPKILLPKEHAIDLYERIQKQKNGCLSPTERECLSYDLVCIRHELGHVHSHISGQGLYGLLGVFTCAATVQLVATTALFNRLINRDLNYPLASFFLLTTGLGALTANGIAASLCSQYEEMRADDFAIQNTNDREHLNATANTFNEYDLADRPSPFRKLFNFIKGSATHPSHYSRFLKFQRAAQAKASSRLKF